MHGFMAIHGIVAKQYRELSELDKRSCWMLSGLFLFLSRERQNRKESIFIFHDLFVDLMIMNESVPYGDGIRH